MCRLALRLPTALQIEASYAILFHEGGVSQFTNLDDHCSYCALDFPPEEHLRRIWVLIDFNQNLPKIPNIFRYSRPFFAVCTVSPDPHRHRWLEKVGYKWFYMKPWSILEVVQVYADLTHEVPQYSHSAVALSSVKKPIQNVNSYICIVSLVHLPGPWLCMAPARTSTKKNSSEKSI